MRTEIQEHAGELMTIPLSLLIASPHNVRKQVGDSVDELAALIKSQGLLQNLIVIHHEGKGKQAGKYEVIAGGRRLRALKQLQKRGEISKDEEIVCKLTTKEQALIVSVSENSGREVMHPADEFEAFRKMVDDGHSVDDVADKFGVPPITVRRRLRLANVSPKLIECYRREEASLQQLMALAVTDDHEAQERVWDESQTWQRTPHALKNALTAHELDLRNPVVRFVGVEAYENAGGVVRRDLFEDDDSGAISDTALLRRLATTRLEERAAEIKGEGWGWVEVQLEADYSVISDFGRLPMIRRDPTEDERRELERVEGELRKATDEYDAAERAEADEDDSRLHDLEDRIEALTTELDALNDSLQDWTDEGKQLAGVLVSVGYGGALQIHRGLVRDTDRKQVMQRGGDGKPQDVAKQVHSKPLMQKLSANRTVALQAVVAKNVPVALAALAQCFVEKVIIDQAYSHSAFDIRVQDCWHRLTAVADDVEATEAWKRLQEARDSWRTRLNVEGINLLRTLMELPESELLQLLALGTALTINAVTENEGPNVADAVADAVKLDMSDWWAPSAATYFNGVSKVQVLKAVAEASTGEAESRGLEKLKKAELVTRAESLVADRRWLPTPLRAPTAGGM